MIASLQNTSLDVAEFDEGEAALLVYADRLTLNPASVSLADVDALRDAGFDDRAIHDACAIVSYFAFVNRIGDGLGVELESTRPTEA